MGVRFVFADESMEKRFYIFLTLLKKELTKKGMYTEAKALDEWLKEVVQFH